MNAVPPLPADGRSEIADGVQLGFSRNPPHLPSSISRLRTNLHFNFNKSAPQIPISCLRSPFQRNASAFSLTEVVIALGIFSVSMVGVLALFPVASSTGRESSEETQAAILAQTILDDLTDSAALRAFTNAFIVAGPNTVQTGTWRIVNLNTPATYFVAYDIRVRVGPPLLGEGMKGNPITLKANTWIPQASHWSNGSGVPAGITYLARVEIQPQASLPQVSRATVTVETPASVASSNRRSFVFSSLVSGR